MIVVPDASSLVAALVDTGSAGRWAEDLVGGNRLAAPHLLFVETANILRRLELAGEITTDVASLAHHDLIDLDIDYFDHLPLASRSWELRKNLTIYDACYVALAEELAAPLATLDRAMSASGGLRCPFLTPPA